MFWVVFPLPTAFSIQPPSFILIKRENICRWISEAAAGAGMDLTEAQRLWAVDPHLLGAATPQRLLLPLPRAPSPWRGPRVGSRSQPGAGRRSRGTRATASARTWGCAPGWSHLPRTCEGQHGLRGCTLATPQPHTKLRKSAFNRAERKVTEIRGGNAQWSNRAIAQGSDF